MNLVLCTISAKMDLLQLMQLFHFKVYYFLKLFLHFFVIPQLLNNFFLFTEVASQLGYDNLDHITTEDMTLEVINLIQSVFSLDSSNQLLCLESSIYFRLLWRLKS